MDKATQRALEKLPIDSDPVKEARNERRRHCFIEGYLQAEKDLALTVEDMKTLDDIFFRVSNEMSIGDADNKMVIENYYKEVLRRFNKYKSEGRLYN